MHKKNVMLNESEASLRTQNNVILNLIQDLIINYNILNTNC